MRFHSHAVSSVSQIGATAGALLSVPIADRLGRRLTLLLAGIVFIVGSALQTWPNGIAMLLAGRTINGLTVGSTSFLAPIYIAECAPPHIRGRLVGMYEVFVQTGTCFGFWVNVSLRDVEEAMALELTKWARA